MLRFLAAFALTTMLGGCVVYPDGGIGPLPPAGYDAPPPSIVYAPPAYGYAAPPPPVIVAARHVYRVPRGYWGRPYRRHW